MFKSIPTTGRAMNKNKSWQRIYTRHYIVNDMFINCIIKGFERNGLFFEIFCSKAIACSETHTALCKNDPTKTKNKQRNKYFHEPFLHVVIVKSILCCLN